MCFFDCRLVRCQSLEDVPAIVSTIIGSSELTFHSNAHKTLTQAMTECQRTGASLASIRNADEAAVVENLSRLDDTGVYYIGVYDHIAFEDAIENNDFVQNEGNETDRFVFIDGHQDHSFYQQPGELPWSSNEPDGNSTGIEDMAACVVVSGGLWFDESCERIASFVCRKELLGDETDGDEGDVKQKLFFEPEVFLSVFCGLLITLVGVIILYVARVR